ncbi:hypothetical protein DL764_000211 [Monosporascus ibericus]|uniref:PNPLA domain-containing protein n=1 Tax=Monosporascus ibericus TaxID=155417 RepID=A0A4Q4TUH0_9PEZI|nr:hypothetical protein DL764_000211 [Monosporascus ibericus]
MGHKESNSRVKQFIEWAFGAVQSIGDAIFQKDEQTKWFGVTTEQMGKKTITKLVETPRCAALMTESRTHLPDSPKTQYPRLVSFVGETGAGKSTLIRFLMHADVATGESVLPNDPEDEVPVAGSSGGNDASEPTTGEVNLYADPKTFGKKYPMLFADCEGMSGREPISAKHQKRWHKCGTSYLIQPQHGIDRDKAVKEIYPKFLYLFSDVICMVTPNPKAWAETARSVLQWGQVGACGAVNQYALPALVIVVNAAKIKKYTDGWLSDGTSSRATNDFFASVDQEIKTNKILKDLAEENGVDTMRQLFGRYYHSVHVHVVPLHRWGADSTDSTINRQIQSLRQIVSDKSTEVQKERGKRWMQYDAKLFSALSRHAFQHLASRISEPFDFGFLRRQCAVPESTDDKFSRFLTLSLTDNVEANWRWSCEVIASCLVRHALKLSDLGLGIVCDLSIVYGKEEMRACRQAADQFLDSSLPCSFEDPQTNVRCINTRNGHAKGHQNYSGKFLASGSFICGTIDSNKFVTSIRDSVESILEHMAKQSLDHNGAFQYLIKQHKRILRSAPSKKFWYQAIGHGPNSGTNASSRSAGDPCFACLFGRPQYKLPCGHFQCTDCVADFGEKDPRNPHFVTLEECVCCSQQTISQGYKIPLLPKFCGLRVLSLDGGGVRSIIELGILQRLEALTGLGLPIGQFFDLIVGTSGGGLIALGIGHHMLSATDCTKRFKEVCNTGFQPLEWTLWLNIWSWWNGEVLAKYQTECIETALESAYRPTKDLFGLGSFNHACQSSWPLVAVTTTVDAETWLFANYNDGDSTRYLGSSVGSFVAARATSAAPPFFQPLESLRDGVACRDGGLRDNNPSAISLSESRVIWGDKAKMDLFLSIGSGIGKNPTCEPSEMSYLPDSLKPVVQAFLDTMNGESSWKRFVSTIDESVRRRATRLNPDMPWDTEPSPDAVDRVDEMLNSAHRLGFHVQPSLSPFSVSTNASTDAIVEVALQLRASLFYFHLDSIAYNRARDIAVIKGRILCRLVLPEQERSFEKLVAMTWGFFVNGDKKPVDNNMKTEWPFDMPVEITKKLDSDPQSIRIDAIFHDKADPPSKNGAYRNVTIGGFPALLEVSEHGPAMINVKSGNSPWG